MAAPNAQLTPPPLDPRKIKRLIERLSYDNHFRTHFEEVVTQNRNYEKIRNIDPEFPGPFKSYFLSLQYVLHDPRLTNVYEQHYKNLSNPQILEFVCSELSRQEHLMSELDKGILFEREDHEVLQTIITAPTEPEKQEQKVEDALEKTVKKKEEKKEHKGLNTPSGSPSTPKNAPKVAPTAQGAVRPTSNATPAPFSGPNRGVIQPAPLPSPQQVIPPKEQKVQNPLSFHLKRVLQKVSPPTKTIVKKVVSAGGIFFKKHPVTATAALGSAVGGVVSTVAGWPASPVSGIIIGAFAPTVIRHVVQIIIPPAQQEPEYEDTFEDEPEEDIPPNVGQGAARPGGGSVHSSFKLPRFGTGRIRPGAFSMPGRAMQAARGLRTAATIARVAPLMANPIFWVVVVILILLLIVFLFIILPTTSLFPPFSDPSGSTGDPKVKLVKSGPTEVQNGEKIQYKIEVTYTGSGTGMADISDVLPNNVRYLTSTPSATVNGRTLSWKLTDLKPSLPRPITFEVQPDFNDSWVVNEATGRATQSGGGAGTGGTCPTPEEIKANRASPESCKYFGLGVDIFDTNLSQEAIDIYVNNYGRTFTGAGLGDEAEFRRRIAYIAERSKAVGLNPVIFLALWKSESGFGSARNAATFGCAPGGGVKSFEEELNCAVGLTADGRRRGSLSAQCASPNNPERDQACQIIKGIRDKHPDIYGNDSITLPIASYDDFIETYGPRSPILDGPGTVNGNCMNGYNNQVEVVMELKACKVSSTPPGTITAGSGLPTKCSGTVVNLGYEKILLPLPEEKNCSSTATGACGRPGRCVAPKKIVIHTTYSPKSGPQIFDYFAKGSENRGVGAHFIIDKNGSVIQAVETLASSVEVAYAVANYGDHISLELVHDDVYANKAAAPSAQYTATVKLVKQLMQQYSIPIGNLEYSWKSGYDGYNDNATPGVYGHYQLNPSNRFDPGDGFLRDLREDLK